MANQQPAMRNLKIERNENIFFKQIWDGDLVLMVRVEGND